MNARRIAALAALAVLASAAAPQAVAVADPPSLADDFEAGIGPLWASVVGGSASGLCGTSSGARALLFDQYTASRQAVTVPLQVEPADTLAFFWRAVHTSCSDMESTDTVLVQYSTGGPWQTLVELVPRPEANTGLLFDVPLPPQAVGPATQLRWIQTTAGSTGDKWFLDDVVVGSGRLNVYRSGVGRDVPGSDVATPALTTPATCDAGPCREPTQESTPEVEVIPAGTCVPPTGALVCFDESLTLNPQATPEVPAVCDAAAPACVPATTVPSVRLVRGDAAQASVTWTAIAVDYDGHVDDRTPFGPVSVPVDLSPLADPTTVTLCPATCLLPVAPDGSVQGFVTLTVRGAGADETVTVPLAL